MVKKGTENTGHERKTAEQLGDTGAELTSATEKKKKATNETHARDGFK